jgi:hypothetical protein
MSEQKNDALVYEFCIWSLAERISVRILRINATSEEHVWLDHVVERFSSLDVAWIEYRRICPRNGAFFAAGQRKLFDNFVRDYRRWRTTQPPHSNVSVTPISAAEIKKRESSILCNAKRSAARQVRNGVRDVLHEVTPLVESLAFKSQEGMEAHRVATTLRPRGEAPSSNERRPKRRLPHGVTMPSAPTVKSQRRRTEQELVARTDICYLITAPNGVVQSTPERPANSDLLGMMFDLRSQFRFALKLDRQCRALVDADNREHTGNVTFDVILGEDGVTPAVESVLCVAVRVLDPARVLFAAGHSRMLRLLIAWLPESGVRDVSALRNRALSQFLESRSDSWRFGLHLLTSQC